MNIELKITLWALACAYAIGSSFLYSWVFWSAFNINILEFASFTEILPSTLYTVAIPCIFAVTISTIGEYITKVRYKIHYFLDTRFANKIKHYVHVKYLISITLNLIVVACLVLATIKLNKIGNNRDEFPWELAFSVGIPTLICILSFILIFTKTNLFRQVQIPRQLAVVAFCLIPMVCYLWGDINSKRILEGKKTLLIESDGQCKSPPGTKYRYISSISDKVFAMSLTDKSICVFKYNSLKLKSEKSIEDRQPFPSNRI